MREVKVTVQLLPMTDEQERELVEKLADLVSLCIRGGQVNGGGEVKHGT